MFGIEEQDEEQDPKSQVLQEILDFAREKMIEGAAKGKESPEGGMSVEISSMESPEGMESSDEAKDGTGQKTCPHCGKPC
jgi:hypothetical protein